MRCNSQLFLKTAYCCATTATLRLINSGKQKALQNPLLLIHTQLAAPSNTAVYPTRSLVQVYNRAATV